MIQLKPDMNRFTVIDLSNAFFSIPVDKDSQGWFGFTYKGRKYTYTRLPQGFCNSPTIFSQEMSNVMCMFDTPEHLFGLSMAPASKIPVDVTSQDTL